VICVIPSAGRAGSVITTKLFHHAWLCVPESEAAAYRKHHENVVSHPDDVYGMGQKRQWILDNFDDEIIFMADDDIEPHFMGAKRVTSEACAPRSRTRTTFGRSC
jgi:hypothetical protein